ncbi:MAG: hypothetical protein IT316_06660 [Anaerolineales bacterium]|nr:hypothetical protein [Anaerolineales bacterium]
MAVDATRLAPGAISIFSVKQLKDRGDGLLWRYWLKWVVVDIDQQMVVAQLAKRGPYNDRAQLRPLVDTACQALSIRTALVDAEFDNERNHCHTRQVHDCHSIIPAKCGKAGWKKHKCASRNAATLPDRALSQASFGRDGFLDRQTQALFESSRLFLGNPEPASASA